MAKDPAFLFYTGDFSTGTQFFTDDQLGKYLRLLMAQHQHGHLTEKQMIHICKSYDKDIFIKFAKDDNDMFFNERLEIEINKRKKYTESRSNNKSGRKPTKNKDFDKKSSESYDNHMENENKDKNKDIIEDKVSKVKAKISKEFVAPTLQEFKSYFIENDYSEELATRAWKGYDTAGWKDSNGRPIKNWKQKCQHVWFSSNNQHHKISTQPTAAKGKAESAISVHDRVNAMIEEEERSFGK